MGVTRVLLAIGFMADWQVGEDALERGGDVHKACHYYDERDLDMRTLPEDYRARVRAWALFKQQSGVVLEGIEKRVENPLYRYRGRLDRLATLPGAPTRIILDIKTGKPSPYVRLQTAAYGYAEKPTELFRRMTVELKADGTYRIEEFPIGEYFDDVHTFLGALRVLTFKSRFQL